jgi:exosortase
MENFLSTAIEPTSLDYALPDTRHTAGFLGVSTDTWLRVGVITGLFAAVFWPNLRRLWLKDNPITGEDNWKHGIFVPIVGLYYLFVHREELSKAGARQFIWGPILRPSRAIAAAMMIAVGLGSHVVAAYGTGLIFSMLNAGSYALTALGVLVLLLDWSLAAVLFGIGFYVYGIYPGQNDYFKDLGMIICLFGIVLLLTGPQVMKIAWFPILFLICAIPWPGLVYSWVAEPLQNTAAKVAVHVLDISGVDSFVSGTKIVMLDAKLQPMRVLNVAEACAGMRSLMTFISVAAAIAFLSARPLWEKLVIVASAVPIAIFCNMMRISGQGLLDHYVSPQWSESFAHQFVGMMMLLPAFFMILAVGYLLDKMFIEEADDGHGPVAPRTVVALAARKPNTGGSEMQPVTARIIPPTAAPMARTAEVAAPAAVASVVVAAPVTPVQASPVQKAPLVARPVTAVASGSPVPAAKPVRPVAAHPPAVRAAQPANKPPVVANGMGSPALPAAQKSMRMPPPPPGSVLRRAAPIEPRIIDAPVPPKPPAPKAEVPPSPEADK